MNQSVYVGDKGTEVVLDTGSDISTATSAGILARKPDGTKVLWVGSVHQVTKVRYVASMVTSDFDMSGTYSLQAVVSMPAWAGHGEPADLVVLSLGQKP